MSVQDFMTVDGIQTKKATALHTAIHAAIHAAPLAKWMDASNLFGRGFSSSKIELIMSTFPDMVSNEAESKEQKMQKIAQLKGMSAASAETFVQNIGRFRTFLYACLEPDAAQRLLSPFHHEMELQKKEHLLQNDHLLKGKTVVISGFRDKALEQKLKEVGAKLGSGISKSTFCLIVKDAESTSSKMQEAMKLNVPIEILQAFLVKYAL